MTEEKRNPRKIGSRDQTNDSLLDPRGRPEVTGLGIIASLIIASCFLVQNGTLPLAGFVISLVILLLSASALALRIVKTGSQSQRKPREH